MICLNYGNKYDDVYVYNLLSMVRKNTTYPFDFFCYSDRDISLEYKGTLVPLTPSFEHEGVWNKLRLLDDKALDAYERKIYFDLDIVIQQNVDILFEIPILNLTIIRSLWKPEYLLLNAQEKDTLYNSSIMIWKDASHIHDKYMNSPDIFMLNYKGIDRFFWYESVEIETLPANIVYSFKHGSNLSDKDQFKYREQYKVCIFNQYPKITDLPVEHPLRLIWEGKVE